MKIVCIIPARYASTRFPGKPLVDISGMSMIQRVVNQVRKAQRVEAILVATDDVRIKEHVESFGCRAIMTDEKHQSGTDRCLEAYEKSTLEAEAIINVQGDEPFIDPRQIDELAGLLLQDEVEIATQASIFRGWGLVQNTNIVKVVVDAHGRALYFSRSPIPFVREENKREHQEFLRHVGLYGYKVKALKAISGLSASSLELSESLEQLRWLENGWKIHVQLTAFHSPAVDTPQDLENILQARS